MLILKTKTSNNNNNNNNNNVMQFVGAAQFTLFVAFIRR